MSQTQGPDFEAIRNCLARYCFALDRKDWSILSTVFTSDATAEYPFPTSHLKGPKSIGEAISERIANVTTQHNLTTQTIEINADGRNARTTTYFIAVHMDKGAGEGDAYIAYGNYVDNLTVVNGDWLIGKRVCSITGRQGNRSVMQPSTS